MRKSTKNVWFIKYQKAILNKQPKAVTLLKETGRIVG